MEIVVRPSKTNVKASDLKKQKCFIAESQNRIASFRFSPTDASYRKKIGFGLACVGESGLFKSHSYLVEFNRILFF